MTLVGRADAVTSDGGGMGVGVVVAGVHEATVSTTVNRGARYLKVR